MQGALVFKGGYDARTRKQVKRIVFFFCLFVLFCFVFCFVLFCFVLFCFVLFCFVFVLFFSNSRCTHVYIEKGVRNSKIWQKEYVFQPLKLGVQGIIFTANINIKRVYLIARCITYLFIVAKTDKNTCLGFF